MKSTAAAIKSGFMLSCATIAMLTGGNAMAADAAEAEASDAGSSADIIVTAQRRNESVQDVPMTLQALTGDTLSQFNAVTFDDLLKYTPNVTYGGNGPGAGV